MAVEYDLTLAGDLPLETVAARAVPDLAERPTLTPETPGGPLCADLYDARGLLLTVHASRRRRHISADGDDGVWQWEPDRSVNLGFRLDTEQLARGTRNMLAAVARVLQSGTEDAVLRLDADHLLLTRIDGDVRKHRHTWWNTHENSDLIIRG